MFEKIRSRLQLARPFLTVCWGKTYLVKQQPTMAAFSEKKMDNIVTGSRKGVNSNRIAVIKPKLNCFAQLSARCRQFSDFDCYFALFFDWSAITRRNASSAPFSVSSASALRAASANRLYCAGSSGFGRDLVWVIVRPFCGAGAYAYRSFTRWAKPREAFASFWGAILQCNSLLIAFEACCAYPMRCFSAAFGLFQHVSEGAPPNISTFVARFFSLPCLKATYFFFKFTYALQQRRLIRLGRQCAALGGQDFSKQFPESVPEFDEVAGLYEFFNCLSRRIQGGHDAI
jgi:hypothetical protein